MTTRGHVIVSGAVGAAVVPPPGAVNIYLDVDNGQGDDANGGTAWNDAVLTWTRAQQLVELANASNPTAATIYLWVRNGGNVALVAESVTFAPHLTGHTRCHVVCAPSQPFSWQVLQTGLVNINGITAEAGDLLAIVAVGGGIVPAATDVGMTLRLTRPVADPNFGEILTGTIVAVDVAGSAYTISILQAVIAAQVFWDADALTIAEVIEPNSVLNGHFTFAPRGGGYSDPTTIAAARNYLFGVRANHITVEGDENACAACSCKTQAGAIPDGNLTLHSGGGVIGGYLRGLLVGVPQFILDATARLWGIFGTTAVTGYCVGNACQNVSVLGGSLNSFQGHVFSTLQVQNGAYVAGNRCRAELVLVENGGRLTLGNFRVAGAAATYAIRCRDHGSMVEYADGALEDVGQGGQAGMCLATDGGSIVGLDDDFEILTAVGANFPVDGWVADGARIELVGGVSDAQSSKIQGRLLVAANEADFEVGAAINMVTARPATANETDITVHDGSRMTVDGNILKTVPNTLPSCCLDVDDCSLFVQKTGNFTHGQAPADWTAAYGNLGLIHVGDDSRCVVGELTDTGVGAGATIAIQVRRKSSLWFAANSGITGAATTKVGVLAAAAFPVGAVLNDLPPGAGGVAGTEELCVVGLTASP